MTNAPIPGSEGGPLPASLHLPPITKGYRRRLHRGRVVSVYCDRQAPDECAPHAHPGQTQVTFVLSPVKCSAGWADAEGKWQQESVTGPKAWVVGAGVQHAGSLEDEADFVSLYVEQSFVREILEADVTGAMLVDLAQLAARDALIMQLAAAFRPLCQEEDDRGDLYVESIGTVLAAHVLLAMFGGERTPDRDGGLPTDALQRVAAYIEANLALDYDLAALAKEARFSDGHFEALFKKSFGKTPKRYFRECQVYKAEALLVTTDKNILEIAELVGFSNDTMLARWFRKVLKCRPTDVRKRLKGN